MRLSLGDIMDSIDGTVGYIMRIFSEGLTTRNREAELYTLPGIFSRPNDADESTVGTEDCVVIENGDDRIIIATKNAKAWANLIAYLSRDLDKGETVFSSEDGTARCYASARPDGTFKISMDNGSTKTGEVTLDPSTGNIDIDTAGGAAGLIRLGGAGATYIVAREDDMKAWWDTAIIGVKALYDLHVHPAGVPNTGVPVVPFPAWSVTAGSATVRCD